MTTIYADDLQPGDVVDYHGELHQITHIERYDGWAWPVAYDDAGWAMALGHDPVVVRRFVEGSPPPSPEQSSPPAPR